MSAAPKMTRSTVEQYHRLEKHSLVKHELIGGTIVAMVGASRRHNLIVMNIGASLHAQFRDRTCEVYPSDMRVHIPNTDQYTYPDVTVVCDPPEFSDDTIDTLTNPTVIVEVLSPSTEQYDRGRKFQMYRRLPSLQDYVLVTVDQPHIEHFQRTANDMWSLSDAVGLHTTLHIASVDAALLLANVYEKVSFDEDSIE